MDIIRVVCGIIFQEDKILICRRKAEKPLGGYWEFPGGKVEPNELESDALNRELQEELSINVEVQKHFKTTLHKYENINVKLIAFKCRFIQSDFTLTDHDATEWVTKTELLKFNLAPADIPIARALATLEII